MMYDGETQEPRVSLLGNLNILMVLTDVNFVGSIVHWNGGLVYLKFHTM